MKVQVRRALKSNKTKKQTGSAFNFLQLPIQMCRGWKPMPPFSVVGVLLKIWRGLSQYMGGGNKGGGTPKKREKSC